MKTPSAFTGLALALCGLVTAASASPLRTVALTGTPAPGTGNGVNFFYFGSPVLNGEGQTAFSARISNPGGGHFYGSGVWSEGGGSGLALVARRGNAAPGTNSGVKLSSFGKFTPAFNTAGQTSFFGKLTGTEVVGGTSRNNRGIWSEGGGSGLALVARTGNEAPGTSSGVNFSFFGPPALNDAGQTAFLGFLTGTGLDFKNNSGIWSEAGGSDLALVVRAGNAAPGTSSGVNFSKLFAPVLNDAGQTAFRGRLTGMGVNVNNEFGIWSEGGGNGLALVARAGNTAPGTGSGVNFSDFGKYTPAFNAVGQTAFVGYLTGMGVFGGTSGNNLGIWSEGGGSGLALVARSGSAVPGMSSGVNFSGFGNPVLNDMGQTAFFASHTGNGVARRSQGIWSEGSRSGLGLVVRSGNAAPGTSNGVSFSSFSHLVLNDAGQTVFLGRLTGPGVDFTNDNGIWAEDRSGVLRLIAREGDLLDVDDWAGTDFRTISVLNF